MTCDCLNHCGDDPWLQDGRSTPCDHKVASDQRQQKAMEEVDMIDQLRKHYGATSNFDLVVLLHQRLQGIKL